MSTLLTKLADIGVAGLGVMGANLALNLADKGQTVAVWDRTPARVLESTPPLRGVADLERFVESLARPRRILMMIKAGGPVDEMIARLRPLLSPGDILIDGGNSFYADTARREKALSSLGINYLGMGISGGEEGARHGPSLMPGGQRRAYELLRPALERIAAQGVGGPCVTWVGPGGAGHFVKMIHNGIEYGDLQLIAETYDLMRRALGMEAAEIAGVMRDWNRGPLDSYLLGIAAEILTVVDPATGRPLVDLVMDEAGQKGTGRWTVQVALSLGVAMPTAAAGLEARLLSGDERRRAEAAALYRKRVHEYKGTRRALLAALGQALRAARICAFSQGMAAIRAGSDEHGWGIELREMARIWTAGCILRSRLLEDIMRAYERAPRLDNLLLDSEFREVVRGCEPGWRHAVATGIELGVPLPALGASLAYFDALTSAHLPQNLTQAQRDYFGAHTYRRTDDPEGGAVHTDWQRLARRVVVPPGRAG